MAGDGMERARELVARAGLGEVPPKLLVGVCVVAVLVVGAAAWRWMPSAGKAYDYEAAPVAADEPQGEQDDLAAPSQEASEPTTSVVVHVVGAVRHPGVVSLAGNSRVADAVDGAGGMLPNAAPQSLNLARVVADGEQVVVLTVDEWDAGGTAAAGAAGSPAAPAGSANAATVDLNGASAAQLEELPGIGPATAEKIVADREANGPFASAEDLMRVAGIGEKKFEALKDAVVVR